jgi:PST family polysaccharide transporter
MQFLITIFSIYILPKYAKIHFSYAFKKEIKNIYKTLLPLVIIGMLIVYFSREILILLIYNDDFLGMKVLFKWQLLADLVRFIANILSFKFLAKNQVKYFVTTQLIGLVTYCIFGHLLINHFFVEGLVIALLLSNIIYFILVLYIMRYDLFGKNQPI